MMMTTIQTEKKRAPMIEINPTSEAFRQYSRAARGYKGAARSRKEIEAARLKSVALAEKGYDKRGRVVTLAHADETLNEIARRTAFYQCQSVHTRRALLGRV